jgi:hypothetical protein
MAERVLIQGPAGGESEALTRTDAERLRDQLDRQEGARNLDDIIKGLSTRITADDEQGPLCIPTDQDRVIEVQLAINQLVGGLPSASLSALAQVLQEYIEATKP